MIVLGLEDLPLDRVGYRAPCVIVHLEEIRLVIRAAIVKCAQPLHAFRIMMHHQRKVLSGNGHTTVEGIGAEIRITVADVVLLAPDHGLLIEGACHIGKSRRSADSR